MGIKLQSEVGSYRTSSLGISTVAAGRNLSTALNKKKKILDPQKICSVTNKSKSDLKTPNSSGKAIDPDQNALSLCPEQICFDLKTIEIVNSDTKSDKTILSIPISGITATCSGYISSVCSTMKYSYSKKSTGCQKKSSKLQRSMRKKSSSVLKLNNKKSNSTTNTDDKTSKSNEKEPQTKTCSKPTEPTEWETLCSNLKRAKSELVDSKKPTNLAPCIRTAKDLDPSVPTLRFIQFLRKNDNRKRLGVVSEDGSSLLEVSGSSCVSTNMCCFLRQNISMFEIETKLTRLKKEQMSDDHRLLPPIRNPGKIICVEVDKNNEPLIFCKFSSSLVGARDTIFAHKSVKELDCDVELAVIVGKRGKCVPQKDAMDYVFGYCIVQDITARDWQKGSQFIICRSMDTFCPLGPSIVHKSLITDPYKLKMRTFVNGVERQAASTEKMSLKIDEIICRISQIMTIEPGDIIITKTPKTVGGNQNDKQFLKPGDCIESEISCLGRLLNTVAPG